jgi:hypothetical protein
LNNSKAFSKFDSPVWKLQKKKFYTSPPNFPNLPHFSSSVPHKKGKQENLKNLEIKHLLCSSFLKKYFS